MLPLRVTGNFLWLLPVLLSLAGNNQVHATLKCHEITDGSSFNNFKECQIHEKTSPYFGHSTKFVKLDFSDATGDEITTFFDNAKQDATLGAAVKMVENQKADKISFGKVSSWPLTFAPPDEVVIEITNNPNLATIEWNFKKFGPLANVRVLFYNNPLLVWDSTSTAAMELIKKAALLDQKNSYIEMELHVCTFQDPTDKAVFITPVDGILENCKKFKGDLKLVKGTLSGGITFVDGCLSLTGVDMTGVTKIDAKPNTGKVTCGNKDPSEIKNNKGLCGDIMGKVKEYFKDPVTIELDDSCTKTCSLQAEVDHPYYRCSSFDGTGAPLSIEQWFAPGPLAGNGNLLKSATGTTSIKNSAVTTISLPSVKTMGHLEIVDNTELTTLELPQLDTIAELTITGNVKLLLAEIKTLSKALSPAKSTVECRTDTAGVADIEDLRLCTIIIGDLILKGLKNDVDASKFSQLKEIRGCITVEDTDLSNIEFLDVTINDCTGGHTLKNNPKLCTPAFLEKNPKVTNDQNGKNAKCGKICTSLTQKNCVIFDGNLVIGSSVTAADIQKLETVNGKLTINDTTLPSLEFPALTTITSSTAPALVVANNPTLAMFKMPKIATISSKDNGKPLVRIEKNRLLTDLSQFLPAAMQGTCSRSASSTCLYDLADDSSVGWFQENLVMVIIIGVVLLLPAGGGGFAVWWFVFRKRKDKKEAQADTPTENGEDSITVAEKEPKFEVIEAIPRLYPKTNNLAYLHYLADHIVKQWHGVVQFRIMLRGSHTEAQVAVGQLDQGDLDTFQRYRRNKMDTDRIRLNRKVYLAYKDYRHNTPEFLDNLFAPEIKGGKNNKKKDEKKKGGKETKRAKSGKGSKEKKGKKGKKPKNASKKEKKATKKKTKASKKSSNLTDVESGSGDGSTVQCDVMEEPRQRVKLIHIGSSFEEAMKTVECLKLTILTDWKVSEKFAKLKSAIYLMEYTKDKKTYAMEVELTEMEAPDMLIGKLLDLIELPWFSLLFYAWQHDIVVHTSVPDYLVMSFYVYSTIDLLNYRIDLNKTPELVELFPIATMYPTYHNLFAGKNQTNFDEITAFTLFLTCVLEWAREDLPVENVLHSDIKLSVKQMLLADAAVHRKQKINEINKEGQIMSWDIYNSQAAEKVDGGEIFSLAVKYMNQIYYNRNPDPTPWILPPPAEKLKYGPWVKYDEKEDCLMKEAAETSKYTKPLFGQSLMTVAPAPPVEANPQKTKTPTKDEEKKDKKAEKKADKKENKKKKKTSKEEESKKKNKKKDAKKAKKSDGTEESEE